MNFVLIAILAGNLNLQLWDFETRADCAEAMQIVVAMRQGDVTLYCYDKFRGQAVNEMAIGHMPDHQPTED